MDLTLFPIDTLKTRLQSAPGFLPSGGFSGIYKGVGSAVVGSAPGAALFFVTYDYTKSLLAAHSTSNAPSSSPVHHMLAASLGEIAACAVRVPTEVIKQRAQALQHPSSLSALSHVLSQRATIGVVGVWREMYRGWGVTIMREVPFTVIQFPMWEGLKAWRRRETGGDTVAAWESGVMGSLAGAVAAAVTTPLDVLKTRMMLAREKVGLAQMGRMVVRESGWAGLMGGIGPRVVWIGIGGAVFLGSYEWAHNACAMEVRR